MQLDTIVTRYNLSYISFFSLLLTFIVGSDGWIWFGFIALIGCGSTIHVSVFTFLNKYFIMITYVDHQVVNRIFHSSYPFILSLMFLSNLDV